EPAVNAQPVAINRGAPVATSADKHMPLENLTRYLVGLLTRLRLLLLCQPEPPRGPRTYYNYPIGSIGSGDPPHCARLRPFSHVSTVYATCGALRIVPSSGVFPGALRHTMAVRVCPEPKLP